MREGVLAECVEVDAERVLGDVLADVRHGLGAIGTLMDLAANEDDGERSVAYLEAAREVVTSLHMHFLGNESHVLTEKSRSMLVEAGLVAAGGAA